MKKSGLKLNLGCGRLIKTGYINCDIQKYPGVDKVFDCSSLAPFRNNSVDLIFCHSFFEHLYIYQQEAFLQDCKRVLSESGRLIILGIPDFEMVCKLYLGKFEGQPPFRGTFGLYQAYRLTHGDYEEKGRAVIPQAHKTLFDKEYLSKIFKHVFSENCYRFSYNFPTEQFQVALGVVAFKNKPPADLSLVEILSEFSDYIDHLNSICEF